MIGLKELIWKETEELRVCKICESSATFWISDRVEGTLDLAHCKTSFEVPLIAHVIAYIGIGYIGHILFSGERMNYKLFHIKYHHDQAEVGQKFYISQ